ncbi:MAG TPA: sulfatase, partial [Isosphaeraceae bacterium]|nr:sulfatase [Isosphaeraceae bacterium]
MHRLASYCLGILVLIGPGRLAEAEDVARPNFIVILCDNLGYGDVGCFGSKKNSTPRIDRMAREGIKLASFYSTSGVCTPSRASLLTGCYPRRVGLHRTQPDGIVLRPVSPNGLNPEEVTIAEVLKRGGYSTACVGKWHLGDQPTFLPTRQGFDTFFGIPYSDDMTANPDRGWPPLPLMQDETVIEAPVDRSTLTRRYTEEAITYLEKHKEKPFFLYLAHAMPGSTNRPFASESFQGRSANGPYGDSVEEIDWSTGQILDALARLDLDQRTLVIWTSDNGAPRRDPPQGSNAPLGGWGYTTQEGGMRVPCIARWPGRIPAGKSSDQLTTSMDLLPTFARLANVDLDPDRPIDGHDITPILTAKPEARSPYDAFYYYAADRLDAVRSGRWKLFLANSEARTSP